MKVRLAREEDFEQVMGLMRQLQPADPEPGADEGVFLEILAADHLKLIVAEADGVLVGSCYLNIIPNLTRGSRPYAVIENVITDEGHRKRGVGKAVMDAALELAREAGCYKIMLLSGRADPAVHAFYRRCGFDGDEKKGYILRIK